MGGIKTPIKSAKVTSKIPSGQTSPSLSPSDRKSVVKFYFANIKQEFV